MSPFVGGPPNPIPEEVMEAAILVSNFFESQRFDEWTLGGLTSAKRVQAYEERHKSLIMTLATVQLKLDGASGRLLAIAEALGDHYKCVEGLPSPLLQETVKGLVQKYDALVETAQQDKKTAERLHSLWELLPEVVNRDEKKLTYYLTRKIQKLEAKVASLETEDDV